MDGRRFLAGRRCLPSGRRLQPQHHQFGHQRHGGSIPVQLPASHRRLRSEHARRVGRQFGRVGAWRFDGARHSLDEQPVRRRLRHALDQRHRVCLASHGWRNRHGHRHVPGKLSLHVGALETRGQCLHRLRQLRWHDVVSDRHDDDHRAGDALRGHGGQQPQPGRQHARCVSRRGQRGGWHDLDGAAAPRTARPLNPSLRPDDLRVHVSSGGSLGPSRHRVCRGVQLPALRGRPERLPALGRHRLHVSKRHDHSGRWLSGGGPCASRCDHGLRLEQCARTVLGQAAE